MHSGSNVNQESYSTFCKTVTNGLEIKRKVSDADIPEDESVLSTNDTSSSRKRIESNNGNKDEVYVINNYGVEVSHSSLRERRPLTLHTLPLSSPHSRVSRQLEYSGTPKAQSSSKTTKCVVFLIALLGTYTIFHNFVLLNLVNDSGNDENRMRYQTMSLFKPRKRKSRKSYVVQSLMEHHNNRSGIPIFIAVDKEKDLPSERLQLLIDMIEDQNAYSEKRHQKYLLFPFSHDDQIQFLEESISSECFLLNASTLPQQYNSAKLLWKYCSLYLFGGIYLDISKVTLLQTQWMLFSSPSQKKESGSNSTTEMSSDENVFILDLARQQLEESFMIWNEIRSSTLLLILKYILHNMNYTEEQDPTVISKHESTRRHFLFQAYHNTRNNRTSLFLEQRCAYNDETLLSPQKCEVYHPRTSQIVMLTNSDLSGPPLPPCHSSKPDECHPIMFPKHSDELASIISMETIYLNKAQKEQLEQDTKSFVEVSTPNFFQIMLENDCLPTNRHCKACLVSEGSCKKCQSICSCYCNAICHPKFKVRRKLIQKKFIVKIPWQHHHHNMIPRKIHQIWIDELSKEQYPKMSRAVNSFKNSNWGDHYFWDLERDIPTFLQAHFPPEVVNAYNSLTLSRFKSDLARYCLLLVHGGVYAEPDIILNVDLHNAIDKDIGFASVVVNISRPVVCVLMFTQAYVENVSVCSLL